MRAQMSVPSHSLMIIPSQVPLRLGTQLPCYIWVYLCWKVHWIEVLTSAMGSNVGTQSMHHNLKNNIQFCMSGRVTVSAFVNRDEYSSPRGFKTVPSLPVGRLIFSFRRSRLPSTAIALMNLLQEHISQNPSSRC